MATRSNAGPAQAGADVPGAQGAEPSDDERADHVDIDPTTGESYGTQVTPDEGGGNAAASPVPPADEDTPPAAAQSPRDAAMEAIRARARESRDAEIAAARDAQADQLQMLEHTAGAGEALPDDEADDAGQPPTGEDSAAQPQQPSPGTTAQADYITINVRGQERQLPIRMDQLRAELGDDADEALRQIQKHYAGDQRMQDALSYEQQLQQFHERLNRVRDNLLRGLDENGQPIRPQAQPSQTGTPSPRQPSSADADGYMQPD